jgi:hypothetical protein
MGDQPTADSDVVLEDSSPGYWRYRSLSTGRRWEVRGVCDHRGDCLVGATVNGTYLADLDAVRAASDAGALDTVGDTPVLPGFSGCCPLTGEWLS